MLEKETMANGGDYYEEINRRLKTCLTMMDRYKKGEDFKVRIHVELDGWNAMQLQALLVLYEGAMSEEDIIKTVIETGTNVQHAVAIEQYNEGF